MRTNHPFLDDVSFAAFAHRGAHEEAGENTAEAFEAARRLGYRFIETDVHASRDGVAVMSHDEDLSRVMGRPGRIGALPWAELAACRTRRGEALARLDDVLTGFPALRFNLDAKSDAAVEPMAEAILRCDARDRVCIASEEPRRTRRLLGLLAGRVCWSPGRAGVLGLWLSGWGLPVPPPAFPVVQVPPRYRRIPVVTRRFIAKAHRRGVKVHVWTIDAAAEMERLIDLGVDGLMTDRPRLLRQVLERRALWPD